MSANLPAPIDPWQAVAREAAYAGSLDLAALPRLRAVLANDALNVDAANAGGADSVLHATYALTFRRDEARRPVVLGRVQGALPLECQRCLGVLVHQVDAQVQLMLVPSGTTGDVPHPYEPLPVVDDRVNLVDLVEDELLLALPQIPMHHPDVCRPAVQAQDVAGSGPAAAAEEVAQQPSPFAALADWKSETNN